MRRLLLALTVLALLPLAPARAVTPDEAQAMVRQTTSRVLERLRQDREKLQADPKLIYPLVEDLVLPHFDFKLMSRWALGRYWRQISPQDQGRFTDQFRTLLVRTYATALLQYTDQKVRFLPMHAADDDKSVTVKTEILQPGGYHVAINYSVFREQGEWKVYDISVDGVSLVTNYRSSFSSDIRQGGVEALLKHLQELNDKAGRRG